MNGTQTIAGPGSLDPSGVASAGAQFRAQLETAIPALDRGSHAATLVAAQKPPPGSGDVVREVVHDVATAQANLDQVLHLAQSGKTFTPAELLGLQAKVYAASQQLDLCGKVVEKAAGGLRQVLQTQL